MGGTPDSPSEDESPREAPKPAGRIAALLSEPSNRFALLFLVYLAAIGTVYPLFREDLHVVIEFAERGTAGLVAWMMSPFEENVKWRESFVTFGTFSVEIIEECTGVYEMMILGAAILAYPYSWGRKLQGLAMGIPIIYALNLVRIAVLLAVGRYQPKYFDFVHIYFWQVTMVLMVTAVFLLWLWMVRRATDPPAPA